MTSSYEHESRTIQSILYIIFWRVVGQVLFSLVPMPLFPLRSLILKAFGSTVGSNVKIYPSVRIWSPANLVIQSNAAVGRNAYLYNKSPIIIEQASIISESCYICTASHDYNSPSFDLISRAIRIKKYSWIAAHAIVLPGVTVEVGCVLGAGSVLSRSTLPWSVFAGNPAVFVKQRVDISA